MTDVIDGLDFKFVFDPLPLEGTRGCQAQAFDFQPGMPSVEDTCPDW